MKVVERIALALFSNLILIIAVLLCLIIFGWLDINVLHSLIVGWLDNQIIANVTLGVSIVCILLSIYSIFFAGDSKEEERSKEGIMLENESGKLMVTRETLENLANSVAKGFENTENVNSKILLDDEHNVRVLVTLTVKPGAVIKDLSNNLQSRIKETIKTSLDLDVKEVNVRVKNIAPKQNSIETTKKEELQ